MTINLKALSELLAPRAAKKQEVVDSSITALRIVDEVPIGYVWPGIRDVDLKSQASVILAVAPGAVGKTAAAEALSGLMQWPLVDAAKAQVGSYSLSGLLHDSLGFESRYISQIASRSSGLIIDALDEAHLKAGTTNFEAFLDNIRKLSSPDIAGPPSIVIFSRPDTAEFIRLFFAEAGNECGTLSIDYFNYEQAGQFLESHLNQLHRRAQKENRENHYDIYRRHPESYIRLRDERMREISQTLLTKAVESPKEIWNSVSGFLGYAPVLAVLAEFLAVPNPSSEISRSLGANGDAKGILLRIIDDLLVREQGKFWNQAVPKLKALLPAADAWDKWETVYSESEQGVRLVAKYLDLTLSAPSPASLPNSVRASYESNAAQFIADHPFLSGNEAVNVVFADYILAKAAVDMSCRMQLDGDPRKSLRAVGPFFYQFVSAFAFRGDKDVPQIAEELVSSMIESSIQSKIDPSKYHTFFFQSGDNATLLLEDGMHERKGRIEFDVVETTGALTIPASLSYALISSDAGIVLGRKGEPFTLGPMALIGCGEMEIHAENLYVNTGTTGKCLISAPSMTVASRLKIDISDPGGLQILSTTKEPSVRPFVTADEGEFRVIPSSSYVDLRAILRSFRQGSGHEPSVFCELLDKRIIKDNPRRAIFLRRLQEIDIVSKVGSHYYISTKALSARGISWHAMADGIARTEIMSFIAELLSRNP